MFVQLNPDIESYSETISTLKFAERVSGVELGAARSNKEGRDVRELLEQVLVSILPKRVCLDILVFHVLTFRSIHITGCHWIYGLSFDATNIDKKIHNLTYIKMLENDTGSI